MSDVDEKRQSVGCLGFWGGEQSWPTAGRTEQVGTVPLRRYEPLFEVRVVGTNAVCLPLRQSGAAKMGFETPVADSGSLARNV